jgi:ankyrin repeat protein
MGCDVNAQDGSDDTPIHRALDYFDPNDGGHITVLMYLLSQTNININIKSYRGNTLLHYACNKINHLPLYIFKVLIETQGCDVNAQADNKTTPIHCALDQFNPRNCGNITVLTYLINHNTVNINIKGRCDRTLLHTTCLSNPSNPRYSAELNAENDTILSQIVEFIAERCVQEVFEEKTPLEATTTM